MIILYMYQDPIENILMSLYMKGVFDIYLDGLIELDYVINNDHHLNYTINLIKESDKVIKQ